MPSEWMPFNANDSVRVKLTAEGRRVYRAFYKRLGLEPMPLDTDASGWTQFQLWRLMQVFGPSTRMGGPNLFEMTMQIESKRGAPEPDAAGRRKSA
jgi:hypothetical protein